MKKQRNWRGAFRPSAIYVLAFSAFLFHQIAQHFLGSTHPFLDGYLDPFLAIGLLLGAGQAELRYLTGDSRFRLPPLLALGAGIGLALIMEVVFPLLDPERQTYDRLDFLAYGLGTLAFVAHNGYGPRATR